MGVKKRRKKTIVAYRQDYLSNLYDMCLELGIWGAMKCVKDDDVEVKRIRETIERYCKEQNILFETYLCNLAHRVEERRKEIEINKGRTTLQREYSPLDDSPLVDMSQFREYDPHDVDDAEIDDGYYDNKWSEDET